jgi:hypothetical protein
MIEEMDFYKDFFRELTNSNTFIKDPEAFKFKMKRAGLTIISEFEELKKEFQRNKEY